MPDMDMARYISVQNIKFVAQIEVWSPKVGSVPPNQDILQILHAGAAFGRRPQSFDNRQAKFNCTMCNAHDAILNFGRDCNAVKSITV